MLLIAGFKTKIVASFLALFVLTVTLIFHAQHVFSDSMQLTVMLKNISIFGGLLIIIAFKNEEDISLSTKKAVAAETKKRNVVERKSKMNTRWIKMVSIIIIFANSIRNIIK